MIIEAHNEIKVSYYLRIQVYNLISTDAFHYESRVIK